MKQKMIAWYWSMDPATALVALVICILMLGYFEACWA